METTELIKILRNFNPPINIVKLHFDGSGDSGELMDPEIFPDNDTLETVVGESENYSGKKHPQTLRGAIIDWGYNILEEKHGGWEINEGSYGDITLDAEKGRIEIEFNERYEDVRTYNNSWET